MEIVQEYKDTTQMTKEELIEYHSKPYKSKSGITVRKKYNENGKSFNDHLEMYLKRVLKG